MKLPNLVNLSADSSSKIGHDFNNNVVQKLKLSKNVLLDKEILESFLFCMYLGSFTLHKAKWVQLKGKTLQVLKNS